MCAESHGKSSYGKFATACLDKFNAAVCDAYVVPPVSILHQSQSVKGL